VLPGLLERPLDAETLVEVLLRLLPDASRVEARLDESAQCRSPAGRRGRKVIARDILVGGLPRGELRLSVAAARAREAEAVVGLVGQLAEQRLAIDALASWRRHAHEVLVLGEAAGALVHAVNNHLNSALMQATLMQMKSEGELRDRAGAIRQESLLAAECLRPAQAIRPWSNNDLEEADLTAAVRSALSPELLARVELSLPAAPLWVAGAARAVERLVELMVRVGLRCVSTSAGLRIEAAPGRLAVHLPGVRGEAGGDGRLELPVETTSELGKVEREAVRWLVRMLETQVEVREEPGGLVWEVVWEE
jgi:hypothetical protein